MKISFSSAVLRHFDFRLAYLELENQVVAFFHAELQAHPFVQCHHERTVLLVNPFYP